MAETKVTKDELVPGMNTYSSSEQDTGKVWIDGRTIYRKSFSGYITVVAGSTNIAHGITGLTNTWSTVSIAGSVGLSSGNPSTAQSRQPITGWVSGTTDAMGIAGIGATNITIYFSFGWGASIYNITMEYVK